jgi:peptidylprolyl isomerase
MTRTRDRFFAGFGALLLLLSASAITIVVIVSSIGSKNDANNQTATKSSNCEASASIAADSLALPETFKPAGDVKALEVTDLEAGTGAALKSGDCIQVKYYGTLAKDGTVFDENFDKPTGFQFQLGQGNVIPGWDQGLVGKKIGSTVRLVIPSDLAYCNQANGSIPANSDLVFIVKILKVTK